MIADFFKDFLKNKIFFSAIIAWLITQTIKVLVGVVNERRFNFKWFVGTGGMPSSHAAGVSALATSVGMYSGFGSPLFALAVLFALITMFDAQGVRRASGIQAEILNKIVDELYKKGKIKPDRLKELLGHIPLEVIIGSILGIFIAVVLFNLGG